MVYLFYTVYVHRFALRDTRRVVCLAGMLTDHKISTCLIVKSQWHFFCPKDVAILLIFATNHSCHIYPFFLHRAYFQPPLGTFFIKSHSNSESGIVQTQQPSRQMMNQKKTSDFGCEAVMNHKVAVV